MTGGFAKSGKCYCYGTVQIFGLNLAKYELTSLGVFWC